MEERFSRTGSRSGRRADYQSIRLQLIGRLANDEAAILQQRFLCSGSILSGDEPVIHRAIPSDESR